MAMTNLRPVDRLDVLVLVDNATDSLSTTPKNVIPEWALLLDAGPQGATLLHNAAILGVDFGAIDAVVLSHGHWDHGGGLLAAAEAIGQWRTGFGCYVHPGMFAQRGSQRPDGTMFVQERLPEPARLTKA